jgi:2-polyprenyl-3-methyl-5-hydroxy-6-metoxy-1,4-benzoquinol methylase
MSGYPHLDWFSRELGIPPASLIRGFELERAFHTAILAEADAQRRQQLYADIYAQVHPLYRVAHDPESRIRSKLATVDRFESELRGRSVLDVGCGDGAFLNAVSRRLPHGRLQGIDVDVSGTIPSPAVEYRQTNVVEFTVDTEFDVVFSDNVMEHIAPADMPAHLESVYRALKPGGTLIVIMPHRLFGPHDVTRIIDNTYSNRVPAMGSHLNESTYTEMMAALRRGGFTRLRARHPQRTAGVRISPRMYGLLEQNTWLLRVLRSVRPRFQLSLVLMAQRPS